MTSDTAKSISLASLVMMSSVFLSRILGVVREQVLATMVGTSGSMDAYVAAFLIPEFLNHLLAGGFMSITFIPMFQKHLAEKNEERAWRMFSNILVSGSLIMVFLILVSMAFTRQIMGLFGNRVGGADVELAVRMTRIILPAQLFFYWGALFMAVQFAHKRFFVPALAPLFYNGGIILGGILLGRRYGVEGFAWGVLSGAFIGNAVVQLAGLHKVGCRIFPGVNFRDPDLIRYIIISLPLVLGLGMQFSNEISFRIFGGFLGEGGLSSLNYSLRIMWVLVGLFGQAVGIASFPYLTNLAVEGKYGEMNKVAFGVLDRIGIMLIPVSAVLIALAPETLGVVFQRGRFTATSTAMTTPVLQFYLVGAFAFAAMTIVTRCFYALQNTVLPMVVSTVVALGCIPVYWLLSYKWAASGIAVAGSVAAILQLVVLVILWIKRHGIEAPVKETLKVYGKAFLAGAFGFAIALAVKSLLWKTSFIANAGVLVSNLIVCVVSGAIALVDAYLVLWCLGVSDAAILFTRLMNKLRR